MPPLENLAPYVAGALVYALGTYLSKRARRGDPESFSPRKFARALLVGLALGLIAWHQNLPINPSAFESLAASTGIVAVADQAVKLLFRAYPRVRDALAGYGELLVIIVKGLLARLRSSGGGEDGER